LLRVDPERRFFTPPSKAGLGAAEWVNFPLPSRKRAFHTPFACITIGSCHNKKVFFLTFLDLVFLQIPYPFAEMLVFTKFAFDFDLGFFYICFNHPQEVDLFIPKI